MAKAGLSAGFSTLSNPYSYTERDLSISAPELQGIESAQNAMANAAMLPNRIAQMPGLLPMVEVPQQPAAEQAPASSDILYNSATKEFAVAGQRIAADDATRLLQSESSIGQPAPPGTDLGPGFQPVTTESYQQMLAGIKDPSFGAMVGRGFEIGTQNLKTLYGSALQSVSGGEYGGGMVKSAEAELAKLQPYQRDVAEGVTADWLATSLGQQGPMILESALTMLAGAAVGAAAAGPGAGFLAGLAGLFGKKAVKEKILQAAAKYNTAKAAGVALNSTEELKQATKLLRQAGAVVGGAAASFAGNEVIAAGDIYSEGGSPVESWVKGVPYAALDLLPEAGAVKWALMGGRRAALPKGATLGQRALEYGVKRFGGGLALLGTAEGLTETAQEGIVLEAGGKDMTSPEALNRYLNSFAAGFAVGGLMGGVANLRSRPETKEETNLLDNQPPGTQGDLFPDMPVQAGPPRPPSGGGAVAQPVGQEVSPDQMGFDFGPQQQDLFPLEVSTPYGVQPTEDRRAGIALPETAPGQLSLLEPTQDVLPFFEPGPELQQRMQPAQGMAYPDFSRFAVPGQELDTQGVAYPDFAAAARASQVNPAQGVLQFAEPAPSGVGFTDQQPPSLIGQRLLEAQQAQQAANLWDQRRAVDKNRDYELALAQQQLQLASASEMGGWDAAGLLPTVEPRLTQDTQLLLPLEVSGQRIFDQPRPTRAEKLKQGPRPAAQIPEVVPATQKELEAAGQLRLFNDEGEATVAAAKGAGLKRKRGKPREGTDKQRGPTGYRGKTAREKATEEAAARAETQRKADEAEAKRKADEAEAKRKADALKRGAAAEKRKEEARRKAEEDLAKKRAAKKPGELIIEDDGIEGREVAFAEVPNGNSAFQYAVGKVEADGGVAVFRRPASDRGTYGGWRVETDVNKLVPLEETETVTAEEEALNAEIQEIEDKLLGLESDGDKRAAIEYVKKLYKRGVITEASLNDAKAASKDRDFGVEDIVSAIRQDVNDYETERRNAVQEQGTDEVSARGEPETGEGVGPNVRRTGEPPRKGRLRKAQEEVTTESVPEGQVTREEEAVKPRLRIDFFPRDNEYGIYYTDSWTYGFRTPAAERSFKTESEARAYAAIRYPDLAVETKVYVKKEEEAVTPAKKSEAAPAAATEEQVSERAVTEPSEPVMIQFSLDGNTMTADGREMLRVTNEQIDKHNALLDCLKG